MNDEDKILSIFLSLLATIIFIFLIYLLSIPFWSDTKKACDLWEEQNGKKVCIKETTYFCLERECSNE